MRISRAGAVLAIAFLLLGVGSVMASTYQLNVVAHPLRSDYFYPFAARLDVFVTDAATGQRVPRALVHVTWSVWTNGDTPEFVAGGAYYRKTKTTGFARFAFPLVQDWTDNTMKFHVLVDNGTQEGFTQTQITITGYPGAGPSK